MYYEYWGLNKPAFDNVPDPSMYVDCHASMENAIAETLFAIEEGDECIAVIVGDAGLGKTMSLRMIIDSLDQSKYKIALITNPGVSFVQMLQEIIGQLAGKQCDEKRKVNLLETFNHLLFSTYEEGKKILIFIDEANAIAPANLENLRLLTNMQGDRRNLFTMVLAGQIEFAKRLEHPKRANLFQRVGTYSRIDKLESAEKVRKYVETRAMLAGARRKIFADDAFEKLWEQSDYGIPRLVNKISKLCLKAGETNRFEWVTGEMIDQIGSRFHKLTGPAVPKRRARKILPEQPPAAAEDWRGEIDAEEGSAAGAALSAAAETAAVDETAGLAIADQAYEPAITPETAELAAAESPEGPFRLPEVLNCAPAEAGVEPPGETPIAEADFEESYRTAELPRKTPTAEAASEEEISVGQVKIKINVSEQLVKQYLSSSREHRFRLAGGLAAETLRKHPQLIAAYAADPVPIWEEIRNFVLNRIERAGACAP